MLAPYTRSRSPTPSADVGPALSEFLAQLSEDPGREIVGQELEALQAIYGEDAILPWASSDGEQPVLLWKSGDRIRYEILTKLEPPFEDISIRLLVTLPSTYPASSPPQLQLLSRYVGAFGVDSDIFGSIIRTYISSAGVEWTEDQVVVFDGVERVRSEISEWYGQRISAEKAGEILREDQKGQPIAQYPSTSRPATGEEIRVAALPVGITLVQSEPINDRKSTFVGHACHIDNPTQVPDVLAYLMADRRIARAAHPIINAWRCEVDGVMHQDNDDDGESAAGSRLAHLLQIMELNNVLVVVTRYFGGIHLGADRFKHINQAARNALEIGGFLEGNVRKGRDKGKGKR
ncbi:hypothetical protein BOTBODRAFT_166091 [Botryobasidium botryosum FD-172 SS1]|uniref:RWD domain-containing protein n=1 Tax=Botryobasidium botryosum (strain FD-172 SS1) TaxID=930990 RepID=A0A067M8P8_BOTB1|nr:hypothetical protein BOTBODRAFT_166091 [Botryobasidium botryosum FD-172 SS1]